MRIKQLDPTQVEVEISISIEELEGARERAFRKLVKTTKIPGFRPGKAPRTIFEAQYGAHLISERAMEDLVPRVYSQGIKENDLAPLEQPRFELLLEEGGGEQAVRLRAVLAVRPRIELKAYKGIAVTSPRRKATDEEYESAIAELRRLHATLVPVDRPVELGDVPMVDYEGKLDGAAFAGGSASNQSLEIAQERFIPGFADGIVGMNAGETKSIEVTFPEQYGSADLAGKKVVFSVTVHENKVAELPPLDDEFAKRFLPEGTLEDLQASLRERLDAEALRLARERMKTQLLSWLHDAHDVPLPPLLVEREIEGLRGEVQERGPAGVRWEGEELRIEACRRVKLALLIEAIAKAENVAATAEDIDRELTVLAQRYGKPPQVILDALNANVGDFVASIVRSKTIDVLLDYAAVTETTLDVSDV